MSERKSYVCEKLGKTLNFTPDRINFCCSYAEGAGFHYINNENLTAEIIKSKKDYTKRLKHGEIPKECSGCTDYIEKKCKNIFDLYFSKDNVSLVEEIIINQYKQCDCKCVYCTKNYDIDNGVTQNYELLPIIKELYKNNAIDRNSLKVEFHNGNVSEPLIREFIANGCRKFLILDSGIKYLPIIEETTQRAIVEFVISLDCGTRETFEKLKQVDAFEQVINNIKEYSLKTNAIINLKYIIVKDMNDNSWEVSKFLDVVKDLRCVNSVCFDIDYRDIYVNKDSNFKVPKHYFDIINQAKTFCDENRINFFLYNYAQQYMEKNKE